MRRKCYLIVLILMILLTVNLVYMSKVKAQEEYAFEFNYTGDVVVNEEKSAEVVLRGNDATTYTRVRIKVDITGPATPQLLATDSTGTQLDIAQLGYWGPDAGFTVGGTFENITPITAIFPAAGTYTITVSLINLETNNSVITTSTETIEVLEDPINITNQTINETTNNTVNELPKTGTSISEYIIYTGIILTVVGFAYYKIRKARI